MAQTKFKFLLFEPISQVGIDVLEAVGEVRMASDTDEETLIREMADIDGAILRAKGRLSRRVMEHAPRLKVAGRHGVGVDNVDIGAATEHGIQIVNTPNAVIEGVAEHAVGLMLALSKRLLYADRELRKGRFEARYEICGREMLGRSLGVVGFGNIGRRVAEICNRAFSMPISYYDVVSAPEMEKALGAKRVSLEELLSSNQYITVHVPLFPETRGLIGAKQFAMMRPDTLFFNTSRGPVVVESALYEALKSGQIAGAGIDVFEQEPTPVGNPLLGLDNIIATPHMATATEEALEKMALVTEDVVGVLQGRKPRYPVNRLP